MVVVTLRSWGGERRGGKRCEAVGLALEETSSLYNGGSGNRSSKSKIYIGCNDNKGEK